MGIFSRPRRTNYFLLKRRTCPPKGGRMVSLDLSSFLGFTFYGRPIKFQIHSCRSNIVEINA